MKSLLKWILIFVGLAVVGGGLLWSYHRHHQSPEHEEPAGAAEEKEAEEPTVKLDAETQKRLGLAFAHPISTELGRGVTAYGQIVDPLPLAALGADLATAEAALSTSKATAERERGLFAQQQNISRKVLETSEAQLRSDEARARALRRRLQLEWGDRLADLETNPRETLLDALAMGKVVLVRVDVSAGEVIDETPVEAEVNLLGRDDEIHKVETISAAVAVDPKTQAQGFLLVIDHPIRAMRPGAAVVAHLTLPGQKRSGVVIDRAAIVRHEGKGWAYVKKGEAEFERREVPLEEPTARGWFATASFTPEDELVITGAQSLLSQELKAPWQRSDGMLKRVIELSLRHRGVVAALAAVLLVYGSLVARKVKLDVFPEFVPPQVSVQTEAPGLAPEQVEALVTRPVETAVNGAGELENIRSESIQGLSVITAIFKEGADVFRARQTLAERLGELAGTLPQGVLAPKMTPLTSSTMDLLKVGLVSKKMSPMELRTFADWTLRPRLLAVPGVAKVSVFGGEVRQLQVIVRPERLLAFDLTIKEVIDATRAATGVRGAGFVETAAQRILIETEGQALTPAALGAVMLTRSNGATVRLADVARVAVGAEPKFGDTLVQGEPGVLLTMSGQFGANTMEVTRHVEAALAEMKPAFTAAGLQLFPALHRPATFIERALENVQTSLLIGGALVAMVLFLFLLDLRTALISFLSIPLSLLAAVLVLDRWGVSINTMTLGGFAVAIGVVVDDAIIDVENIVRRLRENAGLGHPRSAFSVVLDASLEVRSAVVYATFIVAVVFVPVLMMSGLQGRFFAPLGVAFMLAVGASLLVALTVTPALCLALLPGARLAGEPRWVERLKHFYTRGLRRVHARPAGLIIAALILLAGALACLPFFGGELLPEFREGHFVAGVSTIPGTSLPEMLRLGRRISVDLLKNEHIATVEQQIGRAELGEDTWGPNRCEFHIELKPTPADEQKEVQENIREILGKYPGVQSEVLTFLGDRIGESLSGETAQVVVSVFGESLDALDRKADEVAAVLRKVPGAADVQVKSPPGVPRMSVRLRPERLQQFGFRPLEVLEAVQMAYQGADVTQIYDGSRVEEVTVLLDEKDRRDPESIGQLALSNASGLRLPLRELATIESTSGRDTIQHDGARRRQIVTANVHDRDVVSFVDEARRRVAAQVKLPPDIYLTWTGAAEAQSAARAELLLHSLVAGAGVLVLLSLVFREPRHLLLVLANLPFALVGGVLAVFAGGGLLSLGTLIGFVTLFGITMRNSIMMISHFEHLVTEERLPWNVETALRGAAERFVPILMTALVTGLGLLPLALGTGEAGREIEGPMAIVILGGLLTSTALNLFLLPTLALRFARLGSPVLIQPQAL